MENNALNIFIAYSRNDSDIRSRLDKHLTPMKRNNLVETWFDGLIVPGKEWEDEIKKFLQISDIIILLISIDFIASDYCYNIEMSNALKRHDNSESVVIPILVSHCDWEDTPIAKIQLLPRKGLPISSWNDKDEILTTIAHEIKRIAQNLLEGRKEISNKYLKCISENENKLSILNREIELSKFELLKIREEIKIEKANFNTIKKTNKSFQITEIITEESINIKKIATDIIELSNHEEDIKKIPSQYGVRGWKTEFYVEINRDATIEKRYHKSKERLDKIKLFVKDVVDCVNRIEEWIKVNKDAVK